MNKKIKTILSAVVLVVLLGSAYFAYSSLSKENKPEAAKDTSSVKVTASNSQAVATEKSTAPDFTVTDTQGKQVKLSDYFGKPIVLNFWASWCPPCKSELPYFNEAADQYKENVTFLMIDMVDGQRETQATGQNYVKDQGYTFPLYFDLQQSASNAYDILYLPTTVFIDKDGKIVNKYQGAISKQTLEAGVQSLLD